MKSKWIVLLLIFFIAPSYASEKNKIIWQTLSPGLKYARVSPQATNPWGYLHVFNFDLKKFELEISLAKEWGQLTANTSEFIKNSYAILASNGGFFAANLKPLGLRISRGKIKSPIKKISWWGIFYIESSKPRLANISSHTEFLNRFPDYKHKNIIVFALQSGPRLIVDDQIPKLKPGVAERTALGITKDEKIILAVTQHAPLSMKQLAILLQRPEKQGGFNCKNALNLDGGGSTQVDAKMNRFRLSVSGLSNVVDALLVVKK